VSSGHEQLEQAVALLVEQEQSELEAEPESESLLLPDAEQSVRRAEVLREAELLEHYTERLDHLCHLIAEARRPYCPLNGVLALIPFAATQSDLSSHEWALLLENDFQVVRRSTQVGCPVMAAVCDLEQAPGAEELLGRFPDQQRQRRLGVALPEVAACDADALPQLLDDAAEWICDALVPPLVYRLVGVGASDGGDAGDVESNARLYQFLCAIRNRRERLGRLLRRSMAADRDNTWSVAGCYLMATGTDVRRQQGFVGGIFPQLHELQNDVAWTAQALADDRAYRRWATAGYAGLATAVAAVAGLLVWG